MNGEAWLSGSPDALRGPWQATLEFDGPLSDELYEILTGIPGPRRAVEDEEPREEAFVPGRRIAHRWVQFNRANGYSVVREDALGGLADSG